MPSKTIIQEAITELKKIQSASPQDGARIQNAIRLLETEPKKRGGVRRDDAETLSKLVGSKPHEILAEHGHMDVIDMVPLLQALGAPYANKSADDIARGCKRALSRDASKKGYVQNPKNHFWTKEAWLNRTKPRLVSS